MVNNVVNVFSGSNHCFAICKNRGRTTLKAWGSNSFYQLGLGHNESIEVPQDLLFFDFIKIRNITGGDDHTILLTENDEVYAWGNNEEGQCGILKEVGMVADPADKIIQRPTRMEFFNRERGISEIFSSMSFNYAKSTNQNQLYSWGDGNNYVLGTRREVTEKTPYIIPNAFYRNLNVHQVIYFLIL